MTDLEILEAWKKECLKKNYIPFFLIKKYLGYLLSIENKAMLIYSNISILKEDFASFRYIAAKKTLNSYTQKLWNHSLLQHLIQIYKSEIRDYCKKLTSQKYQILNFATSSSKHPFLVDQKIFGKNIHNELAIKNLIEEIIRGKDPLNSLEKQIVFAKAKGYCSKEISIALKINPQKVNTTYNCAIQKMKNNYKSFNFDAC